MICFPDPKHCARAKSGGEGWSIDYAKSSNGKQCDFRLQSVVAESCSDLDG